MEINQKFVSEGFAVSHTRDGLKVLTASERSIMEEAIAQAEKSLSEGGLPIGAVLARGDKLLATRNFFEPMRLKSLFWMNLAVFP